MNFQHQDAIENQFERWYEEEMPRLFRYLCYQTRSKATAEEITAITCEKALERIAQYDPARGELRAWLFGIARNELRAYYRSVKGSPEVISLDLLPELRVQNTSVEQEYQKKEAFTEVLRSLAALPEREQEVIALRFGANLTNPEIARILGLSENHVSVLLHRTLHKLKQSQKEETREAR